MFAALILSLASVLQGPEAEVTKLNFETNSTLEYWMLTRTAAAGQAPSLALDGMLKAVALLEDVEPNVARQAMGLADAIVAGSGSMEEAAEAFASTIAQRCFEGIFVILESASEKCAYRGKGGTRGRQRRNLDMFRLRPP